jgi:hypothetical protein
MDKDTLILLSVGLSLGLCQAVIIFMMKAALAKIVNICGDVVSIRAALSTKENSSDYKVEHEKLEIVVGKHSDRILKLELVPKVSKKKAKK